MRYLDKLLGEAKTKKSAFKTIEKIKKTKEKLIGRSIDAEDASEKAFDRGDDEEAYKQGDRHHNAMQRSARLSVFADKVKKKAYLKGGGKGDGKPQGKLRLVQHAAYIQLGDILAEALLGEEDKGAELHQRRMRDREVIDKIAADSDKADFMNIKTDSTPKGSDARMGKARHIKRMLAGRLPRQKRSKP